MKAFRTINGELQTAEAPDGALCLTLGSTFDPSGQDQAPIDLILRGKGMYRRRGGELLPIPERTYHPDDLAWEPAPDQVPAAP